MNCQKCNKPATFHITELAGGKPQELHLCEDHARQYLTQSGDEPASAPSMAAALAQQMAQQMAVGQTAEELAKLDQQSCPVCGITFYEFRSQGRLGCPHDYACFEDQLRPLILNIHGDDVATMMKAIQASPWMWIYDYRIDLKNNNHAIVTYYTCPTLLSLEKEGTGREKLICQEMEPKLMRIIADYFNPEIQVIPIKLPPRTEYDDCCCQWEFKLDR